MPILLRSLILCSEDLCAEAARSGRSQAEDWEVGPKVATMLKLNAPLVSGHKA